MAEPWLSPVLPGQAGVIAAVLRRVDAWRGFPLGPAQDPYPEEPATYEPQLPDERPISETTRLLLSHWFRREPHPLRPRGFFKYWPHQRRLVETFIYLYEVCGVRRTEQIFQLVGADPLGPQRDPWAKLGGQLATGSGKTKMMSLLIAWSVLNAICEGPEHLGLGRHALLIAPGLFVRDRLLSDFAPRGQGPSIFFADPVIPKELSSRWDLTVYDAETCPRRLDPDRGALIVTNYHQLLRTGEAPEVPIPGEQDQLDLLFGGAEPARLEAVETPILERFAESRGLLVLNDEAHHVGDEPAHARFEQQARERKKLGEDEQEAMAWIRSLRRLNGHASAPGRLGLQVDLSATLYEEKGTGSVKKNTATFRPTELFRHTVVDYPLAEAIRDNVVKKPILERLVARRSDNDELADVIPKGAPNAWERYKLLIIAGIKRWQAVQQQFQHEGSSRKPILFLLCNNKDEAQEIANYLAYGKAVKDRDTESLRVTGYVDPDDPQAPPLFTYRDPDGEPRSTVIQIHIGKQEDRNSAEWEKIRSAVNQIDQDRIADPSGVPDEDGQPRLIDNPFNVVVSVMMLKEGWDVRNVKVIVPLRPMESRTLAEQTLGRGLRKIHPPELDEDGAVEPVREELYVMEHPSFNAILDQLGDILEQADPDELRHPPEYIAVPKKAELKEQARDGVRLVRFLGLVEEVPDWRKRFDLKTVPDLHPKQPWRDELNRVEVQTYLKEALQEVEREGQHFDLPEVPSFLDLEILLEQVYVNPLLKALQTTNAHRAAIKGVVREFLETKTFALPRGMAISFDRLLGGSDGLIVIGNLTRQEVRKAVHETLLPVLREALKVQVPRAQARLSAQDSADLQPYQARRRNVVDPLRRSSYERAALGNRDEERVARLLDECEDVSDWVYNHRSGVGYFIEYEWRGGASRYFPDFVARAKIGSLTHNFVIEVKGRFDDRDQIKAQEAQRHFELLNEHDKEPWHYLLLLESSSYGRADIAWWERQARKTLAGLLRRQEELPLLPGVDPLLRQRPVVVAWVPMQERYRKAFPVFDLQAVASAFSDFQAPKEKGWMRIETGRKATRELFIARVVGRSMEPSIPAGSWALFRRFPLPPSAIAMDGRKVVVQLRTQADPETGGGYTLKRWRLSQLAADGIAGIELLPENRDFQPMRFEDGDLRVVAEFLEVIGPAEDDAPARPASGPAVRSGGHEAPEVRPVVAWLATVRGAEVPQTGTRRERLLAVRKNFADGVLARLAQRYQIIDGGSSLDPPRAATRPGAQQVYIRRLLGIGVLLCASAEPVQELLRQDPEVEGVLCGDDEAGEIPEVEEGGQPGEVGEDDWHVQAVGAHAAYRRRVTGEGVWVGIVDTGIDATHPEFAGKRIGFADFGEDLHLPIESDNLGRPIQIAPYDRVGHGTRVAGLVAGQTVGVAPGAGLVIAKVTNSRRVKILALDVGIDWLLTAPRPDGGEGVDIINVSAGISGHQPRLHAVIRRAHSFGVEVIAAIGNDGPGRHSSPANFRAVLGVGALDRQGQPWAQSGGGIVTKEGGVHKPDCFAPGVHVRSCIPGGRYGLGSGTSFASPIVAGVAALIRQERGPEADLRQELARRGQTITLAVPPPGQAPYKVRF